MKRFFKLILLAGVSLLLLLACGKEKYDYGNGDNGNGNGGTVTEGKLSTAQMGVNTDTNKLPDLLRPDIEKFILKITNDQNGNTEGTWKKADLPQSITLRTGRYSIEAYSPEQLVAAAWNAPYFHGKTTFDIKDAETTTVDKLVCSRQNMMVSVTYSDTFLMQVKDYRVVVSNGTGILEFQKGETRTGFFTVAPLLVSVTGVRDDGVSFSYLTVISKVSAADHHRIRVAMAMTGSLIPTITIDVTTNDKDVDISIPGDDDVIIDPNPDPDPEPTPDPDPEPAKPIIEGDGFDISQPINLKWQQEKAININVKAENEGITLLKVTIISEGLEPLLPIAGLASVMDLTNPGTMKQALQNIGLIGNEPIKGKSSYAFSIGAFTPLLPVGTHEFKVDVKDGAGATATATLVINVTK